MHQTGADQLREDVRARYAEAALRVESGEADGCGCGTGACCDPAFGAGLYGGLEREAVPAAATRASLGCGSPTAAAELREGDIVLDLGSGGGIDVLLAARRVGETGRVYGLDMTDEMLALARRNAAESGARNVEFARGQIEAIPLGDATVDVVISNCVINLSTDKPAVFAEVQRVLRPGGRLGISDIVAEDRLTQQQRAERGSYAGCIAGALSVSEYEQMLRNAGLDEISVTFTHDVADGMHGAIVKAVKGGA